MDLVDEEEVRHERQVEPVRAVLAQRQHVGVHLLLPPRRAAERAVVAPRHGRLPPGPARRAGMEPHLWTWTWTWYDMRMRMGVRTSVGIGV